MSPRRGWPGAALAVLTSMLVVDCTSRVASRPQPLGRMPSDVLHDIARGRLENPRWTGVQAESALKPLLVQVQTSGLPPEEEVALGLSYFFTFDGPRARPIFEEHRARTDALGRVSWQSLLQMAFVGQRAYQLVEEQVREFRRQFPAVAADPAYSFQMTDNLARHYATSGNHEKAVALIEEDLAGLPIDIPFRSFELPGRHFPSYQAIGRAPRAIEWLNRHRDALRRTTPADVAGPAPQTIPADATTLPHRTGVIHLNPFADLLYPDSPQWTEAGADRGRRMRAIARLERWIPAAERGGPIPLP